MISGTPNVYILLSIIVLPYDIIWPWISAPLSMILFKSSEEMPADAEDAGQGALSCLARNRLTGSVQKANHITYIYIWNIYYKIWWLVIELIHSSADVSHQCRSEEANSRHFSLPMLAIVSSQSHTYLTAAYSGDTVDDMATQCTWAQPITVEN